MEQTPREFAEKLVNEFADIDDMGRFSDDNGFSTWSTIVLKRQAKQCAAISIKHIIKIQEYWGGVDSVHYKFYTEALKELETL